MSKRNPFVGDSVMRGQPRGVIVTAPYGAPIVAAPQADHYEKMLPRRLARGSEISIQARTDAPAPAPALPKAPKMPRQLPRMPEMEERSWTGTIGALMPTPARVIAPAPAQPQRPTLHAIQAVAQRGNHSSWLGRLLILASVAVLGSASTVAAVRMWHREKPQVAAAAAVATIGADRLELAPNRRAIVRVGQKGSRWTSMQPAAVDSMEITGSLVLGRTSSTLVAVDLDRGDTRFAFALPAGERWGQARPEVVGSCFTALTVRGTDAMLHCIDPASGAPRWIAKIAGGQDCTGQAIAVPGAYIQQCPGWTSVIDDRNGNVTVEAGGLAVVQQPEGPTLLRTREDGHLVLAPYSAKDRRFAARGTVLRATVDAPTSAIQRAGKLIVRSSAASEVIATIPQKTGASTVISVPQLQLADDVPFVSDCDTSGAPRFQLVELAPRAGSTFDPELARQRVLALVDTDAGRVTWTSQRIVPAQGALTAVCKQGHYFVTLGSSVWVVDATSGETRSVFGFAAGSDGSFAELAAEHIGENELVGVTAAGPFAVHWRERGGQLPVGMHDATAEVERELGKLP